MVSVLVSLTTANSSVSSRAPELGSCPVLVDTFLPRFLLYLFSHTVQGTHWSILEWKVVWLGKQDFGYYM